MADNVDTNTKEQPTQVEEVVENQQVTEPIPVPRKMVRGDVQSDFVKEQTSIEDSKKEQEQAEIEGIKRAKETENNAKNIQADIDKLKANIQYAKQNNLSSAAMEARAAELEADKNRLLGIDKDFKPFPSDQLDETQLAQEASTTPEVAADRQDLKDASLSQPSKEEVFEQAEIINKQRTAVQAQQLALQEEIDQQREIANETMKELRNEDLQLSKVDNNNFWSKQSTWKKIAMGVAAVYSLASGNAVQLISSFINQDIDQQNLNLKQSLAKREEAYRRVNLELNRLEKMTNDQFKREQINLAKQKFAHEQMKANKERIDEHQKAKLKDTIVKKGIKLEKLTPSQINSIFSKEDFKKAQDLRGEFNKQTAKLGTREVLNAFGDIQALSNYIATGPTDIFLLTKAMKFIDPNSVVREGEFHIAETASPPVRMVVRLAQKFAKGTRLTAADRKDFADNARLLLGVKLRTQEKIAQRYRSLSRQHGIPSSLVVEDMSLESISPREALFSRQKQKNPKIKRDTFDSSIDRLIDAGKLSDKFRN